MEGVDDAGGRGEDANAPGREIVHGVDSRCLETSQVSGYFGFRVEGIGFRVTRLVLKNHLNKCP